MPYTSPAILAILAIPHTSQYQSRQATRYLTPMTRLSQLIAALEAIAPPALQASYDNSGLLVGDPNTPVKGVLVTLDCLEATVEEAVETGCNVIVAHHPIIFSGLKRLTGKTYIERTVIAAIRQQVAIYAIHTNLDSVLREGVSGRLAQLLGLSELSVLQPLPGSLRKLAVYVPEDHTDEVAEAMFAAGAGRIGNYDQASFRTRGTGTFRPLSGANPAVGLVGVDERVLEDKLEVVVPQVLAKAVLSAAREAHPYEEMAYDLYSIESHHPDFGIGAIGMLPGPMRYGEWLEYLCDALELDGLRVTDAIGEPIQRVAVCGGSGASLIASAKQKGAQAYVTADVKYHEFFDAEESLVICDIGHYESERHTIELLYEMISRQFDTFAARMTTRETNPVRLYTPATTAL